MIRIRPAPAAMPPATAGIEYRASAPVNDEKTERASSDVSGIEKIPPSEMPPGVTTKISMVAIQNDGAARARMANPLSP